MCRNNMRLSKLTLALLLGVPALWAGSPPADKLARETALNSANAMLKAENYRGAMLGFMDMIIKDPSDDIARAELRRAAGLAAARERRKMDTERAALLAGAGEDRRQLTALRAVKERHMRAWKQMLSAVSSMAANPDTVKEAVAAYERLLDDAPVYSDNGAEVIEGIARVKAAFYGTIRKEYPYLVEGRNYADERDLASLLFARASSQDAAGRQSDTGSTQDVLDRADHLRRLERGIALGQTNMTKALDLYTKRRWTEAAALLRDVENFDKGNDEAIFYLELADEKAAAETSRKPAVKR